MGKIDKMHEAKLVPIGNSKGIRISKTLLQKYRFVDQRHLPNHITITPSMAQSHTNHMRWQKCRNCRRSNSHHQQTTPPKESRCTNTRNSTSPKKTNH